MPASEREVLREMLREMSYSAFSSFLINFTLVSTNPFCLDLKSGVGSNFGRFCSTEESANENQLAASKGIQSLDAFQTKEVLLLKELNKRLFTGVSLIIARAVFGFAERRTFFRADRTITDSLSKGFEL